MLQWVDGLRCSVLHYNTITQSAIKLGNESGLESNMKCIQRNLDVDSHILVLGFCQQLLMGNVNPDLWIYIYTQYIYSVQ